MENTLTGTGESSTTKGEDLLPEASTGDVNQSELMTDQVNLGAPAPAAPAISSYFQQTAAGVTGDLEAGVAALSVLDSAPQPGAQAAATAANQVGDFQSATSSVPRGENVTAEDSLHILNQSTSELHTEQIGEKYSTAGEEDLVAEKVFEPYRHRRATAWLPCADTLNALRSCVSAGGAAGLAQLGPHQLTCPGLTAPENDPQLTNHVRDQVMKYLGLGKTPQAAGPTGGAVGQPPQGPGGVSQAAMSGVAVKITADCVSQDIQGIVHLINIGNMRAAVKLCGRILTAAGQGVGMAGRYSRQTPVTLQLWYCRLALLVKLRLYQLAATEAASLGHLDQPDIYYVVYGQDTYPGMSGSMVPFNLRILCGEIPAYVERWSDSLDKLYHSLHTVRQILGNLYAGLSEDGQKMELKDDDKLASIDLWKAREVRTMHSIANVLIAMKDYEQAFNIYRELLKKDEQNVVAIWAVLGRMLLQIGDTTGAERCMAKCESLSSQANEQHSLRVMLNNGFLALSKQLYPEAGDFFKAAVEIQPNSLTAVNNYAVCLLYSGHLKQALKVLEELVHRDPARYLSEGLVFNLCTMYELESSRALLKKQVILDLVAKSKGDCFGISALKLPP